MTKVKRGLDVLPAAEREACVKKIISFFQSVREEEIGLVAAEEVLDLFLQDLAPAVYNKAVQDARAVVSVGADDVQYALGQLERQ